MSGDNGMPPLDLSMWRDACINFGADPEFIGPELIEAVKQSIAVTARNLQTEIGPSQIGVPCARWLAHKFAGTPPTGISRPKWAAAVGTAVHKDFTEWMLQYNERHGAVRFLPDLRVYVGDLYPGRPIYGTLDALDLATATVIDLKGLALDTPIPTPAGWSTIRDLQIGDQVFGSDGRPCNVVEKTAVHWDRPCYRVTFDDGSSNITDNVHEWEFAVGRAGREKRVVVSTETAVSMIFDRYTQQRHLRVANTEALALPEIELPVHPYVLGVWLGDGHRESGCITKPDEELFENIRSCGYEVGPACSRGVRRTVYGLLNDLRVAGLIWTEMDANRAKGWRSVGVKKIPAQYLRASAEQRLLLLRGLMDSDGTWDRTGGSASFCSTDKQLAVDVAELIRTLGWKARFSEYTARGYAVETTAYQVIFTPYDVNPFWLSRKADLVKLSGTANARRHLVQSIVPVPIQATQCIQVDAPDSLFLVGEYMIPTHNCPGKSQMDKYGPGKPENPVYDVQVDLYGNGCINAGFPVSSVGILRLPRAGELADATWKCRPHDPQRGKAALARAGAIATAVNRMGPAAIPLMPTVEHFCGSCDYFLPNAQDLTRACPGAESIRERRALAATTPSKIDQLIA